MRPSDRKAQAVLDDSIFEAPLQSKPNASRLEVSSIIEQSCTSVECQDGTLGDRSEHSRSLSVVDNATTSASVKFDDAFVASSSICSVSCSDKPTSSSQSLEESVATGGSGRAAPVPDKVESTKSSVEESESLERSPEALHEPCAGEVTSSDSVAKESESVTSSAPQSLYLSDGDDSHSKPAVHSSKRLTRVSRE